MNVVTIQLYLLAGLCSKQFYQDIQLYLFLCLPERMSDFNNAHVHYKNVFSKLINIAMCIITQNV